MLLQVSRHCHKHKEPSAGKGTRDISKPIYSSFSFCFWGQANFTCVGFLPCAQRSAYLRHLKAVGGGGPKQTCVLLGGTRDIPFGRLLFLSFGSSHVHLPSVENVCWATVVL